MLNLINDRGQEQKLIQEIVHKRDDETKRLADIFHAREARIKNAEIQLKNLQEQVLNNPDNQNLRNKYENAQEVLRIAKEELEELKLLLDMQLKDKITFKRQLAELQ